MTGCSYTVMVVLIVHPPLPSLRAMDEHGMPNVCFLWMHRLSGVLFVWMELEGKETRVPQAHWEWQGVAV